MTETKDSKTQAWRQGRGWPLTRRSTMGGLAAAAVAPLLASRPARAEGELVVGSWGGVWDDTVQGVSAGWQTWFSKRTVSPGLASRISTLSV